MINVLTDAGKAKAHAARIARELGTFVRLVADTANRGEKAYIAQDKPTYAIVVYIDEPGCQCCVGNHEGRFIDCDL